MTIKWTPETDQTLLLKILETSSVSVNAKAISEAWPKDQEIPTPRAISERLVRIRAMAKSSGDSSNFSVPNGKNSAKSTPTKASTPRHPTPKKARSGVKKAGAGKRGHKAMEGSDSEAELSKTGAPPSSNPLANEDSEASEPATPAKKKQKPAAAAAAKSLKPVTIVKPERLDDDVVEAAHEDGGFEDEDMIMGQI